MSIQTADSSGPGGGRRDDTGPRPRGFLVGVLLALLAVSALAPAGTRGEPAAAPPPAPAEEASRVELPVALRAALGRQVAAARRWADRVGVHVADADSGESLWGHAAEEALVPASNVKLATTAAVLDALGPGHAFRTRLLLRGTVADGVLHGDLAVIGGGDPSISWRDGLGDPFGLFWRWARELQARGIEHVDGQVHLVWGLFPRPWSHPEWNPEDRLEWYQVPVAALGFHENVVRLVARPGEGTGRPARVRLEPALPGLRLDSRLSTTGTWRRHRLVVERPGGGRYRISGGIHARARQVEEYVAVADPVRYFGAALTTAWSREGVTLARPPRSAKSLPGFDWRPVAEHRSDLLTAVEITHRESQNLFAESLVRLLGARVCGAGTWERGTRAVTDFLHGLGLEPGSFRLTDGSGLARSNRLAPRHLTHLLVAMTDHPRGPEWLGSLPRGGQPGTSLEDRLEGPGYGDRVAAKTGTLEGVSALSGYARGRSGRRYAFSILVNGAPVWRARDLQDALVRSLVDGG